MQPSHHTTIVLFANAKNGASLWHTIRLIKRAMQMRIGENVDYLIVLDRGQRIVRTHWRMKGSVLLQEVAV